MNDEIEITRHINVMKKINDTENISDVPNITPSVICAFFVNNAYIGTNKLISSDFKTIVDLILKYGTFNNPEVRKDFYRIMTLNYPMASNETIENLYNKLNNSKRIPFLIDELNARNSKIKELQRKIDLDEHLSIMKKIKLATAVDEVPSVGKGKLNSRIVTVLNRNEFIKKVKISDIPRITNYYLSINSEDTLDSIVRDYLDRCTNLNNTDKNICLKQMLYALEEEKTIKYFAEEVLAANKKTLDLYRSDHEYAMDQIEQANMIRQLPQVISLKSYLCGNSTIYTNSPRINAEQINALCSLLLLGKKWDDPDVNLELAKLAKEVYPDKEDAYLLLLNKFRSLPRTFYLVEETNFKDERVKEFVGRGYSNVNIYCIPNPKNKDAGKFYNVYISRIPLDLENINPLDLDKIVPKGLDVDSVEWYVQNKFDPTFKAAGGIILNQDETIGSVSVFKPNDGKVGVSLEKKTQIDSIDNMEEEIAAKQKQVEDTKELLDIKTAELAQMHEELAKKESAYNELTARISEGQARYDDLNRRIGDKEEVEKQLEAIFADFEVGIIKAQDEALVRLRTLRDQMKTNGKGTK